MSGRDPNWQNLFHLRRPPLGLQATRPTLKLGARGVRILHGQISRSTFELAKFLPSTVPLRLCTGVFWPQGARRLFMQWDIWEELTKPMGNYSDLLHHHQICATIGVVLLVAMQMLRSKKKTTAMAVMMKPSNCDRTTDPHMTISL